MLINQCMADKTVERESFLASLLQCEDGDQSCPLPRQLTYPDTFNDHPLDVLYGLLKNASSRNVAPVTASICVAKSA